MNESGTITPGTLANRPKPTAPAPKPTAPAPKPSAHPPAEHLEAVQPTHSDPTKFGRIDDDGQVWLRTGDQERVIGSWQAGDADAGLAHFGRRYDDFSTEVALLETRLNAGVGEPRKLKNVAAALLESLPSAAMLGDIDALTIRLQHVVDHCGEAIARASEERSARQKAAQARKEALAGEAETLANESTQWKVAGDRLRAILDEWKSIHGLDRKTDDVLWKRFSKAREAFNRRRGAHFAELDRERATAKSHKEQLCERAEALSDSTDWGATAGAYRDLLTDWKSAGRAPRDADDTLWTRFKAAQDKFFAARNEATAQRDSEFSDNAQAKSALLGLAEKIDPTAGLQAAKKALTEIQTKWEAIGKVPREQMASLDSRLRAVERKVRDASDSHWRRTDPEAVARAAQFRDRVRSFEDQAAKAEAAGKKKDAEKARQQAQQWAEWADAAEAAVSER